MSEPEIEWAAIVMCERADRWYWAERPICGVASATEPPCVKSPCHDGNHDGTYAATATERLAAWAEAGGPLELDEKHRGPK